MLTKTIDIDEAQTHFQELIALVVAGAEVVLTDKTKPLIRLVPIAQQPALHEFSINRALPYVHDDEYQCLDAIRTSKSGCGLWRG